MHNIMSLISNFWLWIDVGSGNQPTGQCLKEIMLFNWSAHSCKQRGL